MLSGGICVFLIAESEFVDLFVVAEILPDIAHNKEAATDQHDRLVVATGVHLLQVALVLEQVVERLTDVTLLNFLQFLDRSVRR